MDTTRFNFRWAMAVFVILAGLQFMLIAAPSAGYHFAYWAPACAAGLSVLAALAWFTIPRDAAAKPQ